MNTEVKLWFSTKVTKSIIKEVKEISSINTLDKKSVKVVESKINDKLLIVRFISFKGKQTNIVDSIMNTYSDFLEGYNDISVLFETKRKPLNSIYQLETYSK